MHCEKAEGLVSGLGTFVSLVHPCVERTFSHFLTVASDFGSGPFIASFPAGSTTSSVIVPIMDDQLLEGDETFAAQLQIPSNVPDTVVLGENPVAQVVIDDNEEVITINFKPARYEVSEDGLIVELILVASRPSPVPYSIAVNTINGTAQGMSMQEQVLL